MNHYLACYPRSGSTYLRFLLDLNTSYNIGTTHSNGFDEALSTTKEGSSTTTISLKTHFPSAFKKGAVFGFNPTQDAQSKIVVLIRNPYDTLMSFKGLEGTQDATDEEVKDFCKELVSNPAETCKTMLIFLEQSVDFINDDFRDVTRGMSLERTKEITSHADQARNHIGTCSPVFSKKSLYSTNQLSIFESQCGEILSDFFKVD
jgi:hypothetical protein